jgi:hypothetical protein
MTIPELIHRYPGLACAFDPTSAKLFIDAARRALSRPCDNAHKPTLPFLNRNKRAVRRGPGRKTGIQPRPCLYSEINSLPDSKIEIFPQGAQAGTKITTSSSPHHYWQKEPAPGVSPELAKQRPGYAYQYLLYSHVTGQPVGMVRRVPRDRWPHDCWGPIRTAWVSGDEIKTIRHHSMEAARNFLQRQFTRTNLRES